MAKQRSRSSPHPASACVPSSHYYIDGNAVENGRVLVLRYDEATGKYSGEGLEYAQNSEEALAA